MAIADKPTEMSEQVLEAMKKGQQSALDAVRNFLESVDHALPLHGEGRSKRQEVIDSALTMADRLVQAQYDFLSSIIRSAGTALGASHPQDKDATEEPEVQEPEAQESVDVQEAEAQASAPEPQEQEVS